MGRNWGESTGFMCLKMVWWQALVTLSSWLKQGFFSEPPHYVLNNKIIGNCSDAVFHTGISRKQLFIVRDWIMLHMSACFCSVSDVWCMTCEMTLKTYSVIMSNMSSLESWVACGWNAHWCCEGLLLLRRYLCSFSKCERRWWKVHTHLTMIYYVELRVYRILQSLWILVYISSSHCLNFYEAILFVLVEHVLEQFNTTLCFVPYELIVHLWKEADKKAILCQYQYGALHHCNVASKSRRTFVSMYVITNYA